LKSEFDPNLLDRDEYMHVARKIYEIIVPDLLDQDVEKNLSVRVFYTDFHSIVLNTVP
jgi:hypothetical protein